MRHHRGFVMVFVLSVVMLITLLAIGAVAVNRTRIRSVGISNTGVEAGLAAQSVLEMTQHLMRADPNGFAWRDKATFDVSGIRGKDAWTAQIVDLVDNNLLTGVHDNVRVIAQATRGPATAGFQVDLQADPVPIAAASHALVVTGVRAPLVVRSVQGTEYNAANYHEADVTWTESAPFVVGGMSGLYVPSTEAIDYWIAQGTRIDIDVIPSSRVEKQLLSPAVNPYGTANARGIYVIDCENKTLRVHESRVYGTLIIINPGLATTLEANSIEAIPGQPALLVRGNITVNTGDNDLKESTINRNFNPAGAPFLGLTNSDESDIYPVVINGLVVIVGNLSPTFMHVQGCVIVDGNISGLAGYLRVVSSPQALPIPGFTDARVWRVIPGTFRQLTR